MKGVWGGSYLSNSLRFAGGETSLVNMMSIIQHLVELSSVMSEGPVMSLFTPKLLLFLSLIPGEIPLGFVGS